MNNLEIKDKIKQIQDYTKKLEDRIRLLEKPQPPDKTVFTGVQFIPQLRVDKLYDKNGKLRALTFSGSSTLSGGDKVVNDSNILATSTIIPVRKTASGTLGNLSITAQSAGTFTLHSSSGTDNSSFNYLIIN